MQRVLILAINSHIEGQLTQLLHLINQGDGVNGHYHNTHLSSLIANLNQLVRENTNPLHIALIGLQDAYTVFALVLLQQLKPKIKIQLSIYDNDPEQAIKFNQLWHKLQLTLESVSPLNTDIQAIVGCQRLQFNDSQLMVDFHFGALNQQLSLQPTPQSVSHLIQYWLIGSRAEQQLITSYYWQLARLATPTATWLATDELTTTTAAALADIGFTPWQAHPEQENDKHIIEAETHALNQQLKAQWPQLDLTAANTDNIAIIGGGLASTNLCLSLAQRGISSHLFCQDSDLAMAASGNKQGAIYPLLTPENDHLSQFFQQAYLFSRQRLLQLAQQGHSIEFDLCGVVHTGHDDRSQQRLDKIMSQQQWPEDIAHSIDAKQASQLAQLTINNAGIHYPLGGWVCPSDFAKACIKQAQQLVDCQTHFNCQIDAIEPTADGWQLHSQQQIYGPFSAVVLANGAQITQFSQSSQLQLSPFRGQVSHIPTTEKLSKLNKVLCAHGYMTPMANQHHCIGASYIKGATDLSFSELEQQQNRAKISDCYPDSDWTDDLDVSANQARVGVRMVCRDHFPMMGALPDIPQIKALAQTHPQADFWNKQLAPTIAGLYLLGGLGSRGLSSGPLAAETLAALMCGESLPLTYPILDRLNPNRMWLRKLRKGKSIEGI
ncbi:FAD-dependent 5-carboxymethylaminomethyl-2-thiouridine(34) oxidoreductase MnmC [Shewanella marina]|uniref:FAD-dependent 5-carboxymethylaminomethyl-2-thiouridine(34) oxidoreductase MnmC n=1 Tax=Shewanella marina TaxID=487319 RepID=UPI000AA8123B|nr:FAD-dependent 5-carboxymethylaminomethyl-2-thiouridine(34) oxidoreductase MnmC [Shewanella marina]